MTLSENQKANLIELRKICKLEIDKLSTAVYRYIIKEFEITNIKVIQTGDHEITFYNEVESDEETIIVLNFTFEYNKEIKSIEFDFDIKSKINYPFNRPLLEEIYNNLGGELDVETEYDTYDGI